MCGIVAYNGTKNALPVIIKGLKRLEYRGYDSAGLVLQSGEDELKIYKKKGKVAELEKLIQEDSLVGSMGIGHTRWATHGKPNDVNAHPHISGNRRLSLVHNGIIENYASLKLALEKLGHQFESDTDTEVLIHLIEEIQGRDNLSLIEAVRIALAKVVGAYAIVVMDLEEPDVLVAARKSSPLVIGIGENEFIVASDSTPIIEYTKKVVYLKDDQLAVITKSNLQLISMENQKMPLSIQEIEMELDRIEKGGYDYFMMKEIHEQPVTVRDSMLGRVNAREGWARLGGLNDHINRLINANRITLVGCGTSWHSALIGEYLIEKLARIPVEVEYASEFRYRNPVINEGDIVMAISQSGETADTMAALKSAKDMGAFTYGIVNVVGSSIARLADAGSYIHAGPEIGVASTKAFTGQVSILTILALQLAHRKGTISESRFRELLLAFEQIPSKIQTVLDTVGEKIKYIAKELKDANNALYLGRGKSFPVALEGALKLKEISYIHAEGYPAAEMKHGPIALIDENMPIILIATNQDAYEKIVSNVQEVKARGGVVIAIVAEGEKTITEIADYAIHIPETESIFSPLLSVIPLQLLSYYIAVLRGCDVDQPRNLAKSVTVE
ncbi:MAG TPA: glutamine--fructose-6-phosphate transaminase (isomerizing) [Saprospiraceae bacterium]|nr:glutamine--fructose-6-phosphate transaminase (isomerizing) [Saprospiraceae bacterium]